MKNMKVARGDKNNTYRVSTALLLFAAMQFGLAVRLPAQTLAYYKVRSIDKILNLVESERAVRTQYYFPRFEDYPELRTGYDISGPSSLSLLKSEKKIDYEDVVLSTRFFTRNIRTLTFGLSGDTCRAIEITLGKDGYQVPAMFPVRCMFDEVFKTGKINVSFTLADSSRDFRLVVGELWIGNNELKKRLSPSEIFINYPFDNNVVGRAFTTSPFDSYGECAYFPASEKEEDYKGVIFIEDTIKSSARLLSETLMPLVKNYPFYAIRGVDRATFVSKTQQFIKKNNSLPLCEYIDSINAFLSHNLADAHFYIKSPCSNKRNERTPLYSYPIGDRHIVAGVFDDSLSNIIPLGSQILAVGNIDANPVKDLNGLLRRKSGEPMTVTIKTPAGEVNKVSYRIREKYKIPVSFTPANLGLRLLSDSVAYYRVNRISGELPLDFISNLDTINTRKKLILDLRSNGGGDFLAGAQFLKLFIDNDFTYFGYEILKSGVMDSVVVNGNEGPFRYRSDGRVILLVDESTACIAELVVNTLRRKRRDVLVVGRASTRGALSFIYEINLPKDNIVIATNGLDTGRFILDGRSIEGKGLEPDVKVAIVRFEDLQPYEDKVLITAISK